MAVWRVSQAPAQRAATSRAAWLLAWTASARGRRLGRRARDSWVGMAKEGVKPAQRRPGGRGAATRVTVPPSQTTTWRPPKRAGAMLSACPSSSAPRSSSSVSVRRPPRRRLAPSRAAARAAALAPRPRPRGISLSTWIWRPDGGRCSASLQAARDGGGDHASQRVGPAAGGRAADGEGDVGVEGEGEADGVEAGPQIGAGGGHADGDGALVHGGTSEVGAGRSCCESRQVPGVQQRARAAASGATRRAIHCGRGARGGRGGVRHG